MYVNSHWVSEFGPPAVQKQLSYAVGWLLALGWQTALAGICFIVGSSIDALIVLCNPDYVWHSYHSTLLTIATISLAIIFNTVLAIRLPMVESVFLVVHVAGLFGIIIPLWIMAPHGGAYETLINFTNKGGCSSTGLSATIVLRACLVC
jgi:choline transport protein